MLVAEQIFVTAANEQELRELSALFAVALGTSMATGIVSDYTFDDFSFISVKPDWTGKVCCEAYGYDAGGRIKLLGRFYP